MKKNSVCIFLFLCLSVLISGCDQKEVFFETHSSDERLHFGIAVEGLPETVDGLYALEQKSGLPVSMVNFFLQWPQDPQEAEFPYAAFKAIHDLGAVPILTWEPMYYKGEVEYMIPAMDILSGKYDEYINFFALRVRELGSPVIIRFAHEMNLQRYHWGSDESDYGPQSPERYKRMFRYVHARFDEVGADNALFAFCPNSESIPHPEYDQDAAWNTAMNYYPGDIFVDILGMDGYNWGTTQRAEIHGWDSTWRSFEDIFRPIYHELKKINSAKPIMVFETATARQGGNADTWVIEAFKTANSWGLSAVIWFQVDKELEWILDRKEGSDYAGEVRRMLFFPSGIMADRQG
ncbi:MAG: endoglucanase [Desulfonatronovibrio sp. MSAO_Bac4]|nr:MAG: endoglucanase [Desulfonatronovibrio sp. MSAO_Bac4]